MIYKVINTQSPFTIPITSEWIQRDSVIRVLVESLTGAITINLPEISTLNGFWNGQIIVTDVDNNASGNNVTIATGGSDILNKDATNSIKIVDDGASVVFSVANGTSWVGAYSV
jgi:hypothetical protein